MYLKPNFLKNKMPLKYKLTVKNCLKNNGQNILQK